jgi:ribonuclease-3
MNVPEDLRPHLSAFQAAVGHRFGDARSAAQALIHSSWVNENPGAGVSSNERLEFLGDALLDFVMADLLYAVAPALSEGEMSRLRALIVCEASLSQAARDMGIGKWLLMGRGEDLNGGRDRPSILADAMEAVYGAVYLDAGLERAADIIRTSLAPMVRAALSGEARKDYKTALQEALQQSGDVRIVYRVVDSSGPDHARVFRVAVSCDGTALGEGTGHSKKEAEQNAAQVALQELAQAASPRVSTGATRTGDRHA